MTFLQTQLIYGLTRRSIGSTPRVFAYWNKDWKPGKFPVTEGERLAAAKKYNLLPEEYIPTPDDGHGAGDYPHFKPFQVNTRSAHYPWDFPEYRRNFGEPLQENFHLYTEDKFDVFPPRQYLTPLQMGGMFLGLIGSAFFLYWLTENTTFIPVAAKHMPDGEKHYSYKSNLPITEF